MKAKFVQDHPKVSKLYCCMKESGGVGLKLLVEMSIVTLVSEAVDPDLYSSIENGIKYGVARSFFDSFDAIFLKKGRFYEMKENLIANFRIIDTYGEYKREEEGSNSKIVW